MKLYCQKCGSGTSYNMQKPKFCQNCGYSFSGKVEASAKVGPVKKVQPTKKLVEVSEDEEEARMPQNINKLEFDTVGTLQVKGITVANLAGTLTPEEAHEPIRRDLSQVDNKNFLEDFRKEAGTSRPRK